ncbi:ABC transport ATP-binding subunit [Pedobacter sp. BAL39]|uniref:ABC transporter ATP-binding protein n=1 Tax=Pedobacter sp. BAL39 TaxID=391596 RepID=UPI000155953B|nr:ATP-binding cassette domain-containing protein [Pedobacter sp. BAL39]EDM36080.1 ABC transport ATP-binding subunit [Pedobacter sp. BAL39]
MIELSNVSKYFGSAKAVDGVSFSVNEGENLVLLGTSGCGKTTTLKMINRLINPDNGAISIKGKDIQQENPETLRRSIGYVMQNIGLFPHYTIYENIATVPKLLKWDTNKTRPRVMELMKKLHLPEELLDRFPAELSGGQMQRVGLARALVADPPLLLMDEPFGALDNVTRSSIQAEFKQLDELLRKTIIMVTHDVQEAFELADRICLMDKGKIMQIGTPSALLHQPANDFSRKFLDGQRLALEFRVSTLKDIWPYMRAKQTGIQRDQPDAPEEELHRTLGLPGNTSVWTALELAKANAQTNKVSFTALMDGFTQYQKAVRHE